MRSYLKCGYRLNNNGTAYTILGKMGTGASCVAYHAIDERTGQKCVLKEYYPLAIDLRRTSNGELTCSNKDCDKLKKGVERFSEAIERQIKLRNNRELMNQTFYVLDKFRKNNSLYVVVPEFDGTTYLNNEVLSLYDRIRVCKSVAEYVKHCHNSGYLCLDIKPENIYVVPETPEFAMFFDFDSVCKKEEILFGRSTSYTDNWAAPEQIMPSGYSVISEQTDIYILGELLFWSIFNRHSRDEEHRRKCEYIFSDTEYDIDLNEKARELLSLIFQNTIRSSKNNRFHNVEKYIAILDELLIEVYPHKEKIVSNMPTRSINFVGREPELLQVRKMLNSKHVAVLSGVGGIGKSEIAKRFVETSAGEYNSIIYLTYSYNLVETILKTNFISEFEQKDKETDEHFCHRKVDKLFELYRGKNLLIIDNLNVEVEDIEHKDIFEKLCARSCDMIITTRCNQEAYFGTQIFIGEMSQEQLEQVYNNYCAYDEEQKDSVGKMISAVHRHTLVVELIAKQAKVAGYSPKEMLNRLLEGGVLRLEKDYVKWDLKKATVAEHVKGLFSIANVSAYQRELLLKIAFMPVSGVRARSFYEFYGIKNHNDIRYLIDNGWIQERDSLYGGISMHPVVASVVIGFMQNDEETVDSFYSDTCGSMIKFNGDESIDPTDYIAICDAVAMQSIANKICLQSMADFLVRYQNSFSKYGHTEERIELIKYAIGIYDAIYPKEKYVAVREYAYENYAVLINDREHATEHKDLCMEHLKLAKKNKDLFLQVLWYLRLYYSSVKKNQWDISLMYTVYFMRILWLSYKLEKENKKKKSRFLCEDHLTKLYYGYMIEWKPRLHNIIYLNQAGCYESYSENNVFFTKDSKLEVNYIQQAISIRRRFKSGRTINATSNSISVVIDEAKLKILERKYDEAAERLQYVVDYFSEHGIPETSSLYVVHDILGSIALTQEKYDDAIREYKKCLEIADKLNYKKNYSIRIGLSRAYTYIGAYDEARELNSCLIEDLKQVEKEARGHSMAETYYNVGCYYFERKDVKNAEKFLQHSIKHFNACGIYGNRTNIGRARCECKLCEIYMVGENNDNIEELLKSAIKTFQDCLGDRHIDTIKSKQLYNTFLAIKR